LAQGEAGYEVDTGKFKIGDGISNWEGLSYYASGGGGGGGGEIPIASETELGGIKVGGGLTIDIDGTLHSQASSSMMDGGNASEVYTDDQMIDGGGA
jgi:hypothetical protein